MTEDQKKELIYIIDNLKLNISCAHESGGMETWQLLNGLEDIITFLMNVEGSKKKVRENS